MRANTWYSPSKGKARNLMIVWSLLTLLDLFLAYQGIPACGPGFFVTLVIALAYFLVWRRLATRDQQLTASARAERVDQPLHASASASASGGYGDGYGKRAPKTTPGSSSIQLDFSRSRPPESV